MSAYAKATLRPRDGGAELKFMFNPTELAFEGIVETADNPGARSEKSGKPMVSFSNIKASKVTIRDIIFDTFETGENVVSLYISAFQDSVKFAPGKQRPPLYCFEWGANVYLECCFVERLNYKLTKFSANGTPVRAIIDSLTLKETDGDPTESARMSGPKTSRSDTMANRQSQPQASRRTSPSSQPTPTRNDTMANRKKPSRKRSKPKKRR